MNNNYKTKCMTDINTSDPLEVYKTIKEATDYWVNPNGGRRSKAQTKVMKDNSHSYIEKNYRIVDESLPRIPIIQVRLSKEKDGSVSIDRQIEQLRELAIRDGYTDLLNNPNLIILEEHASASKNKVRPTFDRGVEFVRVFEGANPIDWYAYSMDRITRIEDVWNQTKAIFIERRVNLRIYTLESCNLYDSMYDYAYIAAIKGAEQEAKSIKRRSEDAHLFRVQKKYFRGGKTPLGFKTYIPEGSVHPILVPNTDPRSDYPNQMSEVDLIKELYSRVVQGDTLHSITRWLNLSGFPTSKSDGWAVQVLHMIIRNARYAGYMTHKKGKENWYRYDSDYIAKDSDGNYIVSHEGIITPEVYFEAIAKMNNKIVYKNKNKNSSRLAGIVVCANCDRCMVQNGSYKNNKHGKNTFQNYRCTGSHIGRCVANGITRIGIEAVVRDLMHGVFSNPEKLESISKTLDVKEENNKERIELLERIDSKKSALANADKHDKIGIQASINSMLQELDKINISIHATTKSVKQVINETELFDKMWDDMEMRTPLNLLISSVIKEIRISPRIESAKVLNQYDLKKLGWYCSYERVVITLQNGEVINLDKDWAKHINPHKKAA